MNQSFDGGPKAPPKDVGEALAVLELGNERDARIQLGAQSLEESFGKIYAKRSQRPTDEVVERTLGKYDVSTGAFSPEFYDRSRDGTVQAELAELMTELDHYRESASPDAALHAYMEVADIIFQKVALTQRQSTAVGSEVLEIAGAQRLFAFAIDQVIKPKLAEVGLDFVMAQRLAKIKYGVRATLQEKGYKGKHGELEDKLCMAEMVAWQNMDRAADPTEVVKELGFESVGQIVSAVESNSWAVLKTDETGVVTLGTLARQKYGERLAGDRPVERVDFRRVRPLYGADGVLMRTIGADVVTGTQSETYSDKGVPKKTDLTQFKESLTSYDTQPDVDHAADVLRRAASFLWQEAIVRELHTESSDRGNALIHLSQRIELNNYMLKERGIDASLVDRAAKLIFATRIVTERNVALENAMCKQLLESYDQQ